MESLSFPPSPRNLLVLALDIYVVVFDPVAFLNCLNLKNEKKKIIQMLYHFPDACSMFLFI